MSNAAATRKFLAELSAFSSTLAGLTLEFRRLQRGAVTVAESAESAQRVFVQIKFLSDKVPQLMWDFGRFLDYFVVGYFEICKARHLVGPAEFAGLKASSYHEAAILFAHESITSLQDAAVEAIGALHRKGKSNGNVWPTDDELFVQACAEQPRLLNDWLERAEKFDAQTIVPLLQIELTQAILTYELWPSFDEANTASTQTSQLDLKVNAEERTVERGNQKVELTSQEWRLFLAVWKAGPQGRTRNDLKTIDFREAAYANGRSFDTIKSRTNAKLEKIGIEIDANGSGTWRLASLKNDGNLHQS